MPRVENYEYTHPHATPESKFVPGYTGYLPGYGPKRAFQMAKTYGQMTHNLLDEDPVAGRRLAPLDGANCIESSAQDDIWEREHTVKNVKRRHDIVSGYAGYIPRKQFLFGAGNPQESKAATEDYERIQRQVIDIPRILPPQNIFPPNPVVPNIELGMARNVPKYTSFINPMYYNESPFNMADDAPKSKLIPCHEAMGTGKVLDSAVCDMLSAPRGIPVIRERPAMRNWYCNQGNSAPGETVSDMYCQRCGHSANCAFN